MTDSTPPTSNWRSFPGVWDTCWCIQDESNDWWRCPVHGGPNKRGWPYRTDDDRRPHSRSCGYMPHSHGSRCKGDCPTCHGLDELQEQPPTEDQFKSHEATKRVLYHLVVTYQAWRNTSLGLPNEFTDDAVRIGEQHLRDVGWFPADGGWLADEPDV